MEDQFEGQDVTGTECLVAGTVGDARLNRKLAPGERVVALVVGTVSRVQHDKGDSGVVRIQRIRVREGYVIPDETDADDLLHKHRAQRQHELDDLLGTPSLPFEEEPESDD